MTSHPHLRVETDGAVRTVTLDHAERHNAQTPSLWAALAEEARSVPDEVRVVVLRGAGPSFSAGIDTRMLTPAGVPGEERLTELARQGREALLAAVTRYQEGFTAWSECHAVVVAAVQGHALGAGFQLALAADLRVLADDATLAMREIGFGLVPDLGGTKALVDLVGYARALEICASGRPVGAAEAHRLGLATVVVAAAELDTATSSLAESLVAAPAPALRALKPLLRQAVGSDLAAQCRREREAQADLLLGLLAAAGR
ncbi:MAG TPA: enoyl-CoA hydratase/isomerase family protein [Intrasporangium sp.]|uniref:enoyl-CoA hydratase/isomerase family protein n=1 Tax=Intrasporangium sp. TaxID=1925024 RepID=UPI002D78D144|nr:enoyl-CoA hydratase/isomerase family protein [Intrasporangium sp.]HET7398074.1 enoyl-CoA hydratase/isomerase family protein [Intrasporangium sp.]